MKKIGILYICTGPYALFWDDFYKSFEKYFLLNTEKHYFVFTDSEEIETDESRRVHVIKIENLPWPLITLMRFHYFKMIESELQGFDFLMFSNANISCAIEISEDELLPCGNENLFVTTHPGYYMKNKKLFPFDKNPLSRAYVRRNEGEIYVIGAFFGGKKEAFLEMTEILKNNIEEDLKKNIIAKWHDESHLNKYIIGRNDVKVLSPEYCYPVGIDVSYEKKIYAVSKQDKFDVLHFKGQSKKKLTVTDRIKRKIRIMSYSFSSYHV